jgi:hypothetical protein
MLSKGKKFCFRQKFNGNYFSLQDDVRRSRRADQAATTAANKNNTMQATNLTTYCRSDGYHDDSGSLHNDAPFWLTSQ